MGEDKRETGLMLAEMLAEMKAAAGYLRNARIDLETGCAKATAIRTISGGLGRLEQAIAKFEGGR